MKELTIDKLYEMFNADRIEENPFENAVYRGALSNVLNMLGGAVTEDELFEVIELIDLARRIAFKVGFMAAAQLKEECGI